ncbi:MAG: lysophospholipid acyltransferase family protein [Acidobacteriota bacterium]|nr:lysophospholipid acyltransferase family protein [Acidobacteriota bacterium]
MATTEENQTAPAITDDQMDERLYSFASLDQYTLKQRVIIRLAGFLLFWLIRVIGATLKFEIVGGEHLQPLAENQPLIYCFWHNRIPTATYFWKSRGIVVMSSQSFDSEYIARFIQRFGYGTAKGSSTRGARAGLIQMIRAVRAGKSAAFTVDGPRGPIYVAKPGALLLAAKSGAPIIPFSISLNRCWRLKSWDRIEIPKPFAQAVVVIGQPILVKDGNSETELERFQLALEAVRDQGDKLIAESSSLLPRNANSLG